MPPVKSQPRHEAKFAQHLQRLLVRTRVRAMGQGLVPCLAVGGLMLSVAMWSLGGTTGPGRFNGWGLSLSLAAGLLVLIWQLIIKPWRRWRTTAQLARRVEAVADFSNLVVAAEEAVRRPDRWPDHSPVAVELKRRLLHRASEVVQLVAPVDLLPLRYATMSWAALLVAVGVTAFLWLTNPSEMAVGWGRLLHPKQEDIWQPTGGLYAVQGPSQVVAGQDVALIALDFGGGFEQAVAEIKIGAGTWQAVSVSRDDMLDTPTGSPDPYRRWQATASAVHEKFAWRYRRGARVSAIQEVSIRHYPLLTNLGAEIIPPAYTKMPSRTLARLPSWIEVPAGSEVLLFGRVNHALRQAQVIAHGDTLELAHDGLEIGGQLLISEDQKFIISLTDSFGLANRAPLVYEMAAALDQAPGVSLTRPGDDGILPIAGEVILMTEAADDYGLAELHLLVRAGGAVGAGDEFRDRWTGAAFWRRAGELANDPEEWREVETAAGTLRMKVQALDQDGSGLRARFRLTLLADALDLVAGDALEILVEAVDNKEPAPVGRSRSAVLRLQLPSAGDVLTTQAEANAERLSDLEAMRQRSRALNVDLDRLTRELMKNPIPDWTRQQEMEAAITRQQKMQQELARVAQQLQAELDKMAQSQLASEAQLQKADEMGKLLSQNNSNQLSELLSKIEDGGGQASAEEVARAMEEVARNQADMARRLDAALAMLKRMAQQQELEGLTALLEKMIQKQQELADLTRALAAQQEADEAAAAENDEAAANESGHDESSADSASGEEAGEKSGDKSTENSEQQAGASDPQSGEQEGAQSGEPESSEQAAEDLARRQEALEKELAELQEKLEEALENLREENAANPRESNEQMAEAMEKALEQVEKQRQENAMGKASEQLEQMDPAEAAKMQEQSLRDLGSLYSVLLESQQAMEQAMKMEQVGSLRGFAADMLALSAKQEEISQMIPAQLRDVQSLRLTRSQHRVQKAARQVRYGVAELMAEAPNRMMKIMGQLDDLIETMGTSVQAMEDNRSPVARRQARESLSQTNRIVIGLLTEALMQGQGGGGGSSSSPPQSASEQLQQLVQEQAKLNGVTEELRRMLADRGMSQQSRSQMERLGAQQAEMAQRMGELAEERAGQADGDRLLGDLGQMGQDM